MELIPGVFDGTHLILANGELIPLSEVSRGRLELKPYLLFPVEMIVGDGELEEIDAEILYPHTAETAYEKNQLVYGANRSTRIFHLLEKEQNKIARKTDLRHPHRVKTFGYRQLFIEKNDGSEIIVEIDGNSRHVPPTVSNLDNGQELVALVEFYDRPSEFANIIKKAGLEVYTK